ncbi:MAG: RNA polymerase sigma factor [Lachnospiraceae bacterium]
MAGDEKKALFTEQYEAVYRDLYRFAVYTLRNTYDAQDAVSDTVADAYASFSKLRSRESFRSWIFAILSNKCKRRIREYARGAVEIPDTLPADQSDTTADMDVREAFSKLSSEERLILSMDIFAGYSSKEIGRMLHMNENTVRSRKSRALEKMRLQLPEYNSRRAGTPARDGGESRKEVLYE